MAAEEMREIRKIREDTISAVEDLKRRRGGKAAIRAYWGRGEEVSCRVRARVECVQHSCRHAFSSQDGWAPSWIRKQTETTLSLAPLSLPPSSSIASPKRRPTRMVSIDALRARRQSHGGTMNALFGIHQAPTTPPRRAGTTPHKRRPSLVGAVAKRGLDGSITFEAPVGLDDGSDTERGESEEDSEEEIIGSIGRSGGAASMLGLRNHDGAGSEIKRTLEGSAVVSSPVQELDLPSALGSAPGSPRRPANGLAAQNGAPQAALTSAVCNIGMPHAFCLLHSEAMAGISSAWLAQDNL